MKVEAVACDSKDCPHIEVPADGADLPNGWLLVDIYQEGNGDMAARVYCSWACLDSYAQSRTSSSSAPTKRKRRTKAEMEADRAAALEMSA